MKIKQKIIELLSELDRPLNDFEIAEIFDIDKKQRKEFYDVLEQMEKDGELVVTRKKKYTIPEFYGLKKGRLQGHQKGFAFFIADDGSEDVYIPKDALNGAMNNDIVQIAITSKAVDGGRAEGEVKNILKRANDEVVGTFQRGKSFGFVIPDDQRMSSDVYIPESFMNEAQTGDKVVAKIIKWNINSKNPEGKITQILGKKGENEADILSVIKKFNLPERFPNKVVSEANGNPTEVDENELENRRDLREDIVFTIDGADAKDLDDAVSLKKLDNGNYLLGVHIADVTHYVKEGSKIDKEALKRATSVYLIDRVIPMLPERLSNGICSLNPSVDRLTLSVDMEIDSEGKVVKHDIYKAVIKTVERLNYKDVSDILEGVDRDDLVKYDYLKHKFELMSELQNILREKRIKRGMIDFDFAEVKIVLNDDGEPVDIIRQERRIANKIIEEFMLVTNETVAEHMFWLEYPFVYRIHEKPSEEKIIEFNKILSNFGYFIKSKNGEVHPKAVQNLLKKVKDSREENLINKLMLRSLKQAKYSAINEGHFGLAAEYYCHFTSPIRRYPDLQIHRIIKAVIDGKMVESKVNSLKSKVDEVSIQSSEMERIAEQAERDTDDLKMAEYMKKYVGDEFNGFISSVTSFGMYVELDNMCEGMVHVKSLNDDYYIYDEENLTMTGERKGRVYSIGDDVVVRVKNVDIDSRQIDFEIIG